MAARPVILAVDENPGGLQDLERELLDRYARHYSVICVRTAEAARLQLTELAAAGERLALVLAGQWLSDTTGSKLLGDVPQSHPRAKRALLVDWGEWGDPATGDAIFDSTVHGRIDHSVVRPFDPPDELFHQAVSTFLLEWAEAERTAPHSIRVVGEAWSGRAWLPPEIARDPQGFLLTGADVPVDGTWPLDRAPVALETSVPGVLAIGDARHGSVKRVASAVGDGALAIQSLHHLVDAAGSMRERPSARTP